MHLDYRIILYVAVVAASLGIIWFDGRKYR